MSVLAVITLSVGKMVPPNRIPHTDISWPDINYTRTWHNLEADVCCCGESGRKGVGQCPPPGGCTEATCSGTCASPANPCDRLGWADPTEAHDGRGPPPREGAAQIDWGHSVPQLDTGPVNNTTEQWPGLHSAPEVAIGSDGPSPWTKPEWMDREIPNASHTSQDGGGVVVGGVVVGAGGRSRSARAARGASLALMAAHTGDAARSPIDAVRLHR